MIRLGVHLEEFLDHLEEEATRLPRPWAYLLIFLLSGLLWSAIGIAMIKVSNWL